MPSDISRLKLRGMEMKTQNAFATGRSSAPSGLHKRVGVSRADGGSAGCGPRLQMPRRGQSTAAPRLLERDLGAGRTHELLSWAHQCAVVSTQWVGARHVSHVERWSRVLGGAAAVAGGAAGAAFQPGDAAAAGENRRRRSLLWLFGGWAPDRRPHHQCIRSQRQLVSLFTYYFLLICFLCFLRLHVSIFGA